MKNKTQNTLTQQELIDTIKNEVVMFNNGNDYIEFIYENEDGEEAYTVNYFNEVTGQEYSKYEQHTLISFYQTYLQYDS